LTPTLSTNQLSSNRDTPSGKFSDAREATDNGGALLPTAPEKRGENCPPGVGSLEDQFKHIAVDTRRNLTSVFNM
jgi:hypothetical protein